MADFETAGGGEITPQEAFPNPIHRAIYYGLAIRNAWASNRRANQEANALRALRVIPGIVYSLEDIATIDNIRWRRREELWEEGRQEVHRFLLDHNFGTPEFHETVLASVDD